MMGGSGDFEASCVDFSLAVTSTKAPMSTICRKPDGSWNYNAGYDLSKFWMPFS